MRCPGLLLFLPRIIHHKTLFCCHVLSVILHISLNPGEESIDVLCYMQDKTSTIKVNGRLQNILTFLT